MKSKIIIEILDRLGVRKTYNGRNYIVSSIDFISNNVDCFTPITKVLYVEIAKKYNTSVFCVEKGIRNIIKIIWDLKVNDNLISEIFGDYYVLNRPSNTIFLISLYNYVNNLILSFNKDNLDFICPFLGKKCEFCSELVNGFTN